MHSDNNGAITEEPDSADQLPEALLATDNTPQTQDEEDLVEARGIRREELADKMSDQNFEAIVRESLGLIERRFETMQQNREVTNYNLNPFLMLALSSAYNIFSPYEAAEYLQNTKMPHGDATSFGKFIEKNIFPNFGVSEPPEKLADPTLYSPIDAEITVEGKRYFTTWKSGPWTMNQSHAHEMSTKFPEIFNQTGVPIILGIFYGTTDQLNNKPALVARNTGSYFHTLVGSDLWEFVTGVKEAHLAALSAIREAQRRFAVNHGGKTFFEHMVQARLELAESFRNEFGLTGEGNDDMWELLFKRSF